MFYEWRDAPKADFAVIGDPIHHSLSPKMHMRAYQALSMDYQYVPVHVLKGEVEIALDHLTSLGYQGANVTLPHKEAAFSWARSHDEIALKLRVCNTLRLSDRHGLNTDVPGFLRSLAGVAFADGSALILGAGGSSRAVMEALSGTGWEMSLWNRTYERAVALVGELNQKVNIQQNISLDGISLVINTTSASLSNEPLPIESLWKTANRDIFLIDIAYGKEPTRLMKSAEHAGFRTMDGRRMLMEQGALAFEFWLNQVAPRADMLEALQP
jgi:shikimate dehydrogenase